MEGRMTVCNMTIEGGARAGMVAPDETTFAYLEGRPVRAARQRRFRMPSTLEDCWRPTTARNSTRPSNCKAEEIAPQVTWGTNPGMVTGVTGRVPDPRSFTDLNDQKATERALVYMGLESGHADRGHSRRSRVHRLLHQFAH